MSINNKYSHSHISLTELVEKHKCGMSTQDMDKMSDFVIKLKNSPEEYKIMSKNAIKLYEENFVAEKIYKELNKEETETTINVLYNEELISVYTNKIELQKQLSKIKELNDYKESFLWKLRSYIQNQNYI